jgi:hypothetical protein
MKRRRHKVFVVMISTLFCFTSFIVPDIPAAQEKVLKKKHARIDSIIHALGFPPGCCRHGRDKRKFFCDWSKGHDGKCHGMKVVLCTSKRRINWGESAKLAWFCKKADTCELTPDIGPLNPNGCGIIDVSPKKTTKYTLTGKRSGRTARASVTITVVNVPPSISILQPADGAVLTLGTTDLVPIEIEYSDNVGIDSDSFSARINNEDITDLFTVTDTGATCELSMRLKTGSNTLSVTISDDEGLTSKATSQFTVNYLPPTVSLSADPPTAKFGENTTLSWQTTNADKVIIEPGIGEVGLNDSISVTLYEKTTYTISATGPGGTATDSIEIDVTDIPPPGIYYQYDELGRMKRIIRMPVHQDP